MKRRYHILKILTFIPLTTLIFCFPVSLTALAEQKTNITKQNITISFKKENLGTAIKKISEQLNVPFAYDPGILKLNNHSVPEVNFENVSLNKVLDHLLLPVNISYKEVNNAIVLYPKVSEPVKKNLPINVSGSVTDNTNLPLIGVTIKVKDTRLGTVTDESGNFKLSMPDSVPPVLVFSYLGYKTQELLVSSNQKITVVLEEEVGTLNEIIVIGYGEQKKTSVTASVSSLKGDKITKAPVGSISNTLGGRVSGVISRQSSGAPGEDDDQIQIRGIGTTGNSSPLIIVNGIPMDYNQLNPNEVENITILKDAAAVAPYGLAGANGVILVTTKRGKAGEFSLNYDGFYGFQRPTAMPDFLDAYEYASLLSVANQNVGNPSTFTEEQLQKFKDGSEPDRYPNTDWDKEILNYQAPITRHTLSFTGGSEKVRFYSNMGLLYQEGVVAPINFNRYNLTANVDADVTASTTMSLDLMGSLSKNKNPSGQSGTSIFTNVTEIPPILPLKFSNGLAGNAMWPQIYESGYDRSNENKLTAKLQIEQKIPFVQGLALKGAVAYNKDYSLDKVWRLPVTFYSLNAQDEFTPQKAGPPKPTLSQGYNEFQRIVVQGYITYDRSFGKHAINALAVYEGQNGTINNFSASRIGYGVNLDELSSGSSNKNDFDNGGFSSKSAQIGLVYRTNYAFSGKYLVELSGRYDGHYYFSPGKRFAFFPAASLGWRLSEENFIKDNFPWIDDLKIRGSYGKSGNLAGGAFQYLASYGLESSYIFGGTSPYQVQGIYENDQANPDITWETSLKTNVGLDVALWKGKLGFTLDFFKERRSDMLIYPSEILPSEYGIGISQINAGIMENKGLDFSLTTDQKFSNGLNLNTAFNFSFARNKMVEVFENASTYNNPNRRLTGKPYNTRFGLEAVGLYPLSDFESDGSTLKQGVALPTFGPVAPGDIKYADLAGAPGSDGQPGGPDGKIDIHDFTTIGKPLFPEIIFGLNTGVAWKGIDLNMLWQGAGNASVYLNSEAAFPFFNGAKVFREQTNTWTPENTAAAYPRLTPTPITNNTQQSSFWMKNGAYLRLKTLEVGYSLPASLLKTIRLKRLRLHISGQNLLTFNEIKFLDPELGNERARYYFQQKVFSAGLNIGF